MSAIEKMEPEMLSLRSKIGRVVSRIRAAMPLGAALRYLTVE